MIHVEVIVSHFLVEDHVAVREVVKSLVTGLLVLPLVEECFEEHVAVLRGYQRVSLPMDEQHRTFHALHHLQVVEVLRDEHAQELASDIDSNIFHSGVRTHEDEAAGSEHVGEHARRTTAHGPTEQNHILFLEAETAQTLRFDHVIEQTDRALFDFFGVGREFVLGYFLVLYLVTEKAIAGILHAHDRVIEVVLDIVQEVQIIE